ncbi:MAG: 3-dehydroquinate synthase [Desulfobacterales bacterium]|nr:3-dehydroquinate synthase [Desulfobacterales bacterium]
MKQLEISGKTGKSTIMVGEKLANLSQYIPPSEKVVVITDTHVGKLYQEQFPRGETIRIGTGEAIKNLNTVQQIYEQLVALEADRAVFIVGIGGGVVCDIAGFVASTYLRGVRFGFAATTLLAQVDASVGGKNGVNFRGYKNMIGVFRQPEFVLCDPALLTTLPEKERLSGFGEIVKHAAIGDEACFEFLENAYEKALKLDPAVIEQLVYASVVLKAAIVNRDETERGERRILNFGHTFGHAIEKITGVTHGEAVGLGMAAACRLSQKKGLLSDEAAERVIRLAGNLHLPARIGVDGNALLDALRRDKKREGDKVHFVLLQEIGRAVIEPVPLDELEAMFGDLFGKP